MRSMSAVAMLICCCAMLQLTAHLCSAVPEMTTGKARPAGLLGGSRDKRSVFNLHKYYKQLMLYCTRTCRRKFGSGLAASDCYGYYQQNWYGSKCVCLCPLPGRGRQ
uniref:Secreted protein n=1 Tax=Macrostomum lignano TaxID=282301 RepID=A0A1I8ICZ0_9PLAT